MCPVCLTTVAIIAGSATGSGGLTALVARHFHRRKLNPEVPTTPFKEDQDGREPDRSSSQERFARGMD